VDSSSARSRTISALHLRQPEAAAQFLVFQRQYPLDPRQVDALFLGEALDFTQDEDVAE